MDKLLAVDLVWYLVIWMVDLMAESMAEVKAGLKELMLASG